MSSAREAIIAQSKGVDLSSALAQNPEILKKLSWPLRIQAERNTLTTESTFLLVYRKPSDFEQLATLQEIDILQHHTSSNTLSIRIKDFSILHDLLVNPGIKAIDTYGQVPSLESFVRDMNHTVNQVNTLHAQYPWLCGQEMLVSVKEPLFDSTDIDLRGRYLSSGTAASYLDPHATDMATIIGGAGNSSSFGEGVAPAVLLSSSSFENLFPDEHLTLEDFDVSVQNHSYGTQIENYYGALARAYDVHTLLYPSLLHVYSAGNQGMVAGTIEGTEALNNLANLTGNYKHAKNVLTVGSVDANLMPEANSSAGPAYDGRIKPELVAYSTEGTSNAAALVSGVAILLQQLFIEQEGHLPPAHLTRALLINSAEDVGAPGPDYKTGFGNLNAIRAVSTLEQKKYVLDSMSSFETLSIPIEIPNNVASLKVSLCWNDPPADVNAKSALINDLDLQLVQESSSTTYLPWVLSTVLMEDSLVLPAQRNIDRSNNNEQISLQNPESGTYHIKIHSEALETDNQSFAVVYNWELAGQFAWTYPSADDHFSEESNGGRAFRWSSTLPGQTGALEIKPVDATTWQTIAEDVDLDQQFYSWETEASWTLAEARMLVDGTYYTTDTFSLGSTIKLDLAYTCDEEVLLSWNALEQATAYQLYTLSENKLLPILETTDTVQLINTIEYPAPYFAIAPVAEDGTIGPLSPTLFLESQVSACYLSGFRAEPFAGDGVVLTVNVSTDYNVSELIFERATTGSFAEIFRTTMIGDIVIYFDDFPGEGLNIYRAKLLLENGDEIISSPDTVQFLRERDLLLFPNPLQNGQDLQVYTRNLGPGDKTLRITNASGQVVYLEEIFDAYTTVELPDLADGVYYCILQTDTERFTEKLLLYHRP